MDFNQIRTLLESEESIFEIIFVRKTRNSYISYNPSISNNVQIRMKELLLSSVQSIIMDNFEIIPYNPTGYREGTLENCSLAYVGNFEEVIEAINNADIDDFESNIDNLTFYCVKITLEDETAYLFRRITKFKRLYSKGIVAYFNGQELNRFDERAIGLDSQIDLMVYKQEIIVINHIALERIFKLEEQFRSVAEEVLSRIEESEKIVGYDQFEEDCVSDKRIQKILTKMQEELPRDAEILSQFNNVINTIDMFELDIDYQVSPSEKIIYESKSQLISILRLIRDSYYITTVNENRGIDNRI